MVIIVQYREERDEDGVIHIISEEEVACPICAGILKVIGSRWRGNNRLRREQRNAYNPSFTMSYSDMPQNSS